MDWADHFLIHTKNELIRPDSYLWIDSANYNLTNFVTSILNQNSKLKQNSMAKRLPSISFGINNLT